MQADSHCYGLSETKALTSCAHQACRQMACARRSADSQKAALLACTLPFVDRPFAEGLMPVKAAGRIRYDGADFVRA